MSQYDGNRPSPAGPPPVFRVNRLRGSGRPQFRNWRNLRQPPRPEVPQRHSRPRLLMMVGIPGTGKTHFAKRMEKEYGWVRVSQDVLGSRQKCIELTRQSLADGKDVVVDRCNVDRSQRQHWIDIAHEESIFVGCVWIATPFAKCLQRVNSRSGHETIDMNNLEENERILVSMAGRFEIPRAEEGIDFCRVVREDHEVDRVLAEVACP